MIAVVDYGAGNLASVLKGLAAAGAQARRVDAVEPLARAAGIVVPGVGHFGATARLDGAWKQAIRGRLAAGIPLLGICLGMQWLFEGSDEAPGVTGLAIVPGRCRRILVDRPLKVPHVGWNQLSVLDANGVLGGVPDQAHVYFTHSYAAPVTEECAATTTHGEEFAAVIERDQIAGVQFHPEKSGEAGLRILRNFVARVNR